MMHRIEYLLKHNKIIQKTYVVLFSLLFRFIGLFINTDKHQIIFQSMIGKNFGDSPKVLYEEIRKNPQFKDYKFVWAFDDPQKFDVDDAKVVKLNSLSYYIEALKSGIWITNVCIERGLKFKPKKTIYLNTWHGIPIKSVGNSQKTRRDYDYSNVDFMCCSCEFERDILVRDFNIKRETTVKCGMPRNDALYHVTEEKITQLRKKYNIPDGKKVILYAPTWRESADGGKSYGITPPIDVKYWEEKLGSEYVLLFRMHHLTTQMMGIEYNDFARDCSGVADINELMIIADLLISDYSATIFDYSILERPIISFAYDQEEYVRIRGFYENLDSILPGSVFKNQEQVIDHILSMDYSLECKKTKNLKQRYIDTKGNATDECMKYLLNKTRNN